jgi:predicted nucleotidyltransferase
MSQSKIPVSKDKIRDFCQKHHIRKLSLFGSVLTNDFRPDSDVDILVEFEPDHVPGFIRLYSIEEELSHLFGDRKLDLVTPKFLNHRIRDQVLSHAEVQYAA